MRSGNCGGQVSHPLAPYNFEIFSHAKTLKDYKYSEIEPHKIFFSAISAKNNRPMIRSRDEHITDLLWKMFHTGFSFS